VTGFRYIKIKNYTAAFCRFDC